MMKMVMIVRWRTLRMRTITFRCILLQKKGFFFHIIIIYIRYVHTPSWNLFSIQWILSFFMFAMI